jgi:hypothetical protein
LPPFENIGRDREPPPMSFFEYFEYMESKIAEKEALGAGRAAVRLLFERFHT